MYIPPHFLESRIDVLRELIRCHSLATLVTLGPEGLLANHIPFIFDPQPEPFGTLRGHLSRANLQWRDSRPDVAALAIFQGPSAYITPSWYPSKNETGQVVPTYNFVVVHAHGAMRTFDDPLLLERHVRELTAHHESAFTEPWLVDRAPAEFIAKQLKGIVGVEIPIARLEGKWKVSQNRSAADREGVVKGLNSTGNSAQQSVAEWVAEKRNE